jgi:hypothetical protein
VQRSGEPRGVPYIATTFTVAIHEPTAIHEDHEGHDVHEVLLGNLLMPRGLVRVHSPLSILGARKHRALQRSGEPRGAPYSATTFTVAVHEPTAIHEDHEGHEVHEVS